MSTETGIVSAFSNFPNPHVSIEGAFFDQVISVALLLFGIFAVLDPRNHVGRGAQPALIGLLVTILQIGFSLNCGETRRADEHVLP